MAIKLADVFIAFSADDKDVDRAFERTESKTKGFAGRMGGVVQGALMGVGLGVANLAVGAAQQALNFVGQSIGAASDMGETMSQVNTIFGESAAGILAWSQGSAKALGLSRQEALSTAGTLGNMFVQLGAGGEQASTLSQDITQMAADLASFHNVAGGTPQVVDAMTSAFRGEYDALQRYIPTINAAAVEQQALADTGKANADELTALDKALAVQTIIMQDAGAAAGDFARTQGGLANQQRILNAQMSDLKATLGEALLPVWTALITTLNNVVQTVLPPLTAFIREQIVPAMQTFGAVVGNVVGAVQRWFAGFGSSANKDLLGPMRYWQEWVAENMPRIRQIFETVLGAIQGFWNLFGDDILYIVNNTFSVIFTVIDTTMRTIGDLITVVLQVITGDWEGAAETLQGIVERLWEALVTIVSTQLDSLKRLFTAIDWAAVGSSIIEAVKGGISAAWGNLTMWFSTKLQELRDLLPFSEPKDPASPLRNLPRAGAAIVEMIQAGISGASLAISPLDLQGAVGAVAGGGADNRSYSLGSGAIVVNAAPGQSAEEVGAAVARELELLFRRLTPGGHYR